MSCFICCSKLSKGSSDAGNHEDGSGSGNEHFCGETHVGDIEELAFVTRALFQVPEEIVLEKLCKERGERSEGDPILQVQGISLCEACGESVEHAKTVYKSVAEGIQKFRSIQKRLVDKVRRGRRTNGGDEYLNFISSRDYPDPSSNDAFQVEPVESLVNVLLELPDHPTSNLPLPPVSEHALFQEDVHGPSTTPNLKEEVTPKDPLEIFQDDVNFEASQLPDNTLHDFSLMSEPIIDHGLSRPTTRNIRSSRLQQRIPRFTSRKPKTRSKNLCPECGKSCPNRNSLEVHLAVVHGIGKETRHICETCGYGFLYPSDLSRHKRKFKGNCKPVTQRCIRQATIIQHGSV